MFGRWVEKAQFRLAIRLLFGSILKLVEPASRNRLTLVESEARRLCHLNDIGQVHALRLV